MLIKGLMEEDFVNYKKPSMYIAFPYCDFKCDREAGCFVCQNGPLALIPSIDIDIKTLIEKYINNPITSAIVCAGMEPLDTFIDLKKFITAMRCHTQDDIVIYTGYKEEEVKDIVHYLSQHKNIIIKFGRFIPNQEKHYDEVLGVELASPNQYARRIS